VNYRVRGMRVLLAVTLHEAVRFSVRVSSMTCWYLAELTGFRMKVKGKEHKRLLASYAFIGGTR
jgi:hypothetical protein